MDATVPVTGNVWSAYLGIISTVQPQHQLPLINALGLFSPTGTLSNCVSNTEQALTQASALLNGAGHLQGTLPNKQVYDIVNGQLQSLAAATQSGAINCVESQVAATLAGVEINAEQALQNVQNSLTTLFKPYNKLIGTTLYNATGVVRDPIGHGVVPGVKYMMNQVNPNFAASHEAAWVSTKMIEIGNLPANIYGSLQHLQSAMSGGQLFGPIQVVKDVYLGAIAIVKMIGQFIQNMFSMLQKLILNIIGGLLPVGQITAVLGAVTTAASVIGPIVSAFTGTNIISQYTGQLLSVTGSLQSVLSNPGSIIQSLLPVNAQQGLSYLNNPQAFLQTLPPPWGEIFCILNQISGYGYNYNLGYGMSSALAGIQGGVLAGIISAFGCQLHLMANIITPSTQSLPQSFPGGNQVVNVPGRTSPYVVDIHGNVINSPCATSRVLP